VITGVAEDQHAHDSTGKGNGRNILTRRRIAVRVRVENSKDGVDLTNYLSAREKLVRYSCDHKVDVGQYAPSSVTGTLNTYSIQIAIGE
jgi:hypothetical protein